MSDDDGVDEMLLSDDDFKAHERAVASYMRRKDMVSEKLTPEALIATKYPTTQQAMENWGLLNDRLAEMRKERDLIWCAKSETDREIGEARAEIARLQAAMGEVAPYVETLRREMAVFVAYAEESPTGIKYCPQENVEVSKHIVAFCDRWLSMPEAERGRETMERLRGYEESTPGVLHTITEQDAEIKVLKVETDDIQHTCDFQKCKIAELNAKVMNLERTDKLWIHERNSLRDERDALQRRLDGLVEAFEQLRIKDMSRKPKDRLNSDIWYRGKLNAAQQDAPTYDPCNSGGE